MINARAAAVSLALLPLLAACGGSSDSDVSAPSSVPATTTSTVAASAANSSGPIAVSARIEDPEFGETFVASSVVRNFPVPERAKNRGERAELVLVKVDVTVGQKFFNVAGPGNLRLIAGGGQPGTAQTTFDQEMTAAGYPPLKDVKTAAGSGSGWVAFFVEPKDSPTLTLRLLRTAAQVSGSNETIPRKEFDAVLIK